MQNNIIYTRPAEIVGELSGLVTLPTGYDKSKEKLPVIVFLHGAGERSNGDNDLMPKIMTHGIPMLFGNDCDYHGLRVITLSPQCPGWAIWDHLVFPLKKWIEEAVDEFGGDKSRISITGISMGGFGTWDMISTFPDYFYRCAPICGGGTSWRCHSLKGKDIRVFHGIDDDAVPFECSMDMVRVAKASGANVYLNAYDHVGHGSWVKAYAETDLVEWLADEV